MAGEDTAETWYVRARGRILGPLSWAQLLALRERGRLARFDQVSRDRQGWMPADSLERLFPRGGSGGAFVTGSTSMGQAERRGPEPDSGGFLFLDDEDPGGPVGGVAPRTAGSAADEPTGWYYAEAGVPQGPVEFSDLKRLAKDGLIGPDTLYWRSGLEQWTSGSDLSDLHRLWPRDDAPRGDAILPNRDRGLEPGREPTAGRVRPIAIASLISNLFCGVGQLAAIVLGVVAIRRMARSGEKGPGRVLAIAGVALGVVGLLACVLLGSWLFSGSGE